MGTDPASALTLFFTQMVGLSVASERVTETVKQWLGPTLANWSAARYSGAIQTIAIVSGMLVTALSGLNPLNIPLAKPFDWFNKADWLSWVISGILVSGGITCSTSCRQPKCKKKSWRTVRCPQAPLSSSEPVGP